MVGGERLRALLHRHPPGGRRRRGGGRGGGGGGLVGDMKREERHPRQLYIRDRTSVEIREVHATGQTVIRCTMHNISWTRNAYTVRPYIATQRHLFEKAEAVGAS